jgi:cytolysin-activating lysine-acyltransferase
LLQLALDINVPHMGELATELSRSAGWANYWPEAEAAAAVVEIPADAPPTASTAPQMQQSMSPTATEAAITRKPTVSHMLGEIVWVCSHSPTHKHFAIGDLEWMMMPALALEQYRVFRGDKTPVGVALWAYLSDEAEKKLDAGAGRLRPNEWKSGDNLWLVDLIAPFATPDNKQVEAMLADLIKGPFAGKKLKFHHTDPATSKRKAREIGG